MGRGRWHDGRVELLDQDARPIRITVGKVLLAVIVIASFGIWVYAYSGKADRPPPDLLDDPAFAAAAEPICAAALERIQALEPAYQASDNVDRARTVIESNAIVGTMLADLRELPTGGERDGQIVDAWLTDWETFLGNRIDYANRLMDDPTARFYQSDVVPNEMLDARITRLADTNRMYSCANPGDVG